MAACLRVRRRQGGLAHRRLGLEGAPCVILSTKASPWERALLPLDKPPDTNSFDCVRVYRKASVAPPK